LYLKFETVWTTIWSWNQVICLLGQWFNRRGERVVRREDTKLFQCYLPAFNIIKFNVDKMNLCR